MIAELCSLTQGAEYHSLAEVNTMGPLNSWSDEMRVHVVLKGV